MNQDLLTNRQTWLAPLAGYTDRAFRMICKEFDADVLVSEMVSAEGLIRDSRHTLDYVLFSGMERPFGVQLFGSNPLSMARAAEFLLPYQPDFIDINMGCPVKKVVRSGSGSALMRTPELASQIVKQAKEA
ncbi:MAG: tRNA-dihydrouridine synthase family protein, partial [Candidatus Cloacimonadaceae bacterium]|nr:tRNA-dihydrouridine synthase family protein [Candidatus Cloacimonadaceae bacterium]